MKNLVEFIKGVLHIGGSTTTQRKLGQLQGIETDQTTETVPSVPAPSAPVAKAPTAPIAPPKAA